jgi:hypothetical protein
LKSFFVITGAQAGHETPEQKEAGIMPLEPNAGQLKNIF